MFTQSHLLVSTALFARPGAKVATAAALTGAVFPDCDVWLMFLVERLSGSTGCEVFHYRYWEVPWTTLQSIVNSIPMYLRLFVFSAIMTLSSKGRLRSAFGVIALFALSALLHVSTDFLLHHEDARSQLLPLSEWVFRSPVSYWDPDHHGRIFAVFEIALAISLIVLIGRRYARRFVWTGLILMTLGYSGSIATSFMELATHERGPGSCPTQVVVI